VVWKGLAVSGAFSALSGVLVSTAAATDGSEGAFPPARRGGTTSMGPATPTAVFVCRGITST
jgi:hypothetical protein